MLEKLTGKDFQGHEVLVIEFDRYVTTLVGASDVGKTSALRLLRWVCLNQPSGESFVRKGQDRAVGILRVDGKKVIRKRGKGANSYSLDGKEFKALGMGTVPPEIADLLAVSEVNFQRQLDPPFWFLESPGQVSKNLNTVVSLGTIDQTMSAVSTDARKARTVVEVTRDRVTKARQDVTKLEWVEDFDTDLRKVEARKKALDEKSEQTAILRALLEKGRTSQLAADRLGDVGRSGEKAVEIGAALLDTAGHVNRLRKLLKEWKKYSVLAARPVPDDVDALAALRKEADQAAERRRDLGIRVKAMKAAEETAWQASQDLVEAKADLETRFGNLCPTCGQETTSRSSPASPTYTYRSRLL